MALVCPFRKHYEIVGAVVECVFVDVVDMLFSQQGAPKHCAHDGAVLVFPDARECCLYHPVDKPVARFVSLPGADGKCLGMGHCASGIGSPLPISPIPPSVSGDEFRVALYTLRGGADVWRHTLAAAAAA